MESSSSSEDFDQLFFEESSSSSEGLSSQGFSSSSSLSSVSELSQSSWEYSSERHSSSSSVSSSSSSSLSQPLHSSSSSEGISSIGFSSSSSSSSSSGTGGSDSSSPQSSVSSLSSPGDSVESESSFSQYSSLSSQGESSSSEGISSSSEGPIDGSSSGGSSGGQSSGGVSSGGSDDQSSQDESSDGHSSEHHTSGGTSGGTDDSSYSSYFPPPMSSDSSGGQDPEDQTVPPEEDKVCQSGKCPKVGEESSSSETSTTAEGGTDEGEGECGPEEESDEPVRYSSGQLQFSETDLSIRAYGFSWEHTRNYANILSNNGAGINGNSWLLKKRPRLYFASVSAGANDAPQICAVNSASSSLWFTRMGDGTYRPRFNSRASLVYNSSALEFTLTDAHGRRTTFFDNSLSQGSNSGKLKAFVEPGGAAMSATYNLAGQLTRFAFDTIETGVTGVDYAYFVGGPGDQRISYATLLVKSLQVRRAAYLYYGDEANGSVGDLKSVQVEEWDSASETWLPIRRSYYRYYVSGSPLGFVHGLKYILKPDAVARMVADGLDPESAVDSVLAQYADNYFEYDGQNRVSLERVEGGVSEYTFSYWINPASPDFDDVDIWNKRTIETQPDGSQNRVYTNKAGQVLLRILEDGNGNKWYDFAQYNSRFQKVRSASSAAVASVAEPTIVDLTLEVVLKVDDGLVKDQVFFEEDNDTTGAVKGYLEKVTVQKGTGGTPSTLKKIEYDTHEAYGEKVHLLRAQVVYPEEGNTTVGYRTEFEYTWYEDEVSNPTFQIREQITTLPVVDEAEHGTGLEEKSRKYFDIHGLLTWSMNPRGVITALQYDYSTSAVVKRIDDVDTVAASGVPAGWATPTGFGLNLVTDYVVDLLGRRLRALRPWIEIDPATIGETEASVLNVRPVDYVLYRDALHREWRASGFMKLGENAVELYSVIGPVSWTLFDADGSHIVDQIQTKPSVGGAPEDPDSLDDYGGLPSRSQWTSWSHSSRDAWGKLVEARVYYVIPASGDGIEGENFNATQYAYDSMDRLVRRMSPGGTISRLTFDARGLRTAVWVGTDDSGATNSDPSGGGSGGNNMKPTWRGQYDDGLAGGDGNLTEVTLPISDDSGEDRLTSYVYDFRNRQIQEQSNDGATAYFTTFEYDNLNRGLSQSRYHSAVAEVNRTHHSGTSYDPRGRVYDAKKYYVNLDGSLGDALVAGRWYDASDNVIKQTQQGAVVVTKTVYDSLDRMEVQYQVSEDASTAPDNTNDVALDVVITQSEPRYNDASQVISFVSSARFEDAAGTGPLQGPAGIQPRSRDTFVAQYADPVGRVRFSANFGTFASMAWSRPALHSAPSDTVLVSEQVYAPDGGLGTSIDPQGTVSSEKRDAAGRRIRLTENAGGSAPEQRVSEFTYVPDGGLQELVLINPTTGNQTTVWTYGTTLAASGVARSDLPVAKTYPTGEEETQTYNRQGEVITLTDANGSVHSYERDKLGRLRHDCITTLAGGVDGLVRRISAAYDNRGQVATVTSADAPSPSSGDIVNEVTYAYNGIGCLTADAQSHSGVVDGSTPKVQYQCSAAQGARQRRTGIIYPDGRALNYEYGDEGSIDDVLNQVQSVHDDDLTVLAEFQYVGSAMPVVTKLPEPGVERRWKKLAGEPVGDAGDPYTGYDRFGRTEQMRWYKVDGESYDPLVSVQWGYNRASLKTWRRDLLAPTGAAQDQHFGYDGLYQVTQRQRGLLNINATAVSGTPAQQEDFAYDETGNWVTYQQANDGVLDIDQTRGGNVSNQITEIDGSGAGVNYDLNGNMLLVPTGESLEGPSHRFVWDAWNRLRIVKDHEDNVLGEYKYDGQTRRTTSEAGGVVRHFYYNDQWRSVEERLDSASRVESQYVWHPLDRWELVLRDRSTENNGTLDERLYCLKDQLDPVAVCGVEGGIVERYAYSAFGLTSVLNVDFGVELASTTRWLYLFHGEFRDLETEWFNYGYRYYSPFVGGWISRDPLEEEGGMNLYAFTENSPVSFVDYLGLNMTVPEYERLRAAGANIPEYLKGKEHATPNHAGETRPYEGSDTNESYRAGNFEAQRERARQGGASDETLSMWDDSIDKALGNIGKCCKDGQTVSKVTYYQRYYDGDSNKCVQDKTHTYLAKAGDIALFLGAAAVTGGTSAAGTIAAKGTQMAAARIGRAVTPNMVKGAAIGAELAVDILVSPIESAEGARAEALCYSMVCPEGAVERT